MKEKCDKGNKDNNIDILDSTNCANGDGGEI